MKEFSRKSVLQEKRSCYNDRVNDVYTFFACEQSSSGRGAQKRKKEGNMYYTLKTALEEAESLNMAIGAFNTHNLEMLQAILKAAVNQKTPVIVQTSCGTANYVGHRNMVAVCKSMADEYGVDVVLHLDHAKDYAEIRKAIDAGFSSVMFDGSSLPLKDNILGTKRVVEYAKAHGVSVEAELGTVGGAEDGIAVSQDEVCYTDPEDAVEFVSKNRYRCIGCCDWH